MKYRVFIAEDDKAIAAAVKSQCENWDLAATCVENFHHVLEEFVAFKPHLVLLDIGLPCFNGYHWCSEIRKISKVPIIFLSSAADNMNIVMAMNMGGDDFIAKPFDQSVLMAKIHALLRRAYDFRSEVSDVLAHRGAVLDVNARTLIYEGEEIELSKNEYRILLILLESKGKVVSRSRLMEGLWQTDCFVDDNTLTVNINRLRKRLEGIGLKDFITTKFGEGYLIV